MKQVQNHTPYQPALLRSASRVDAPVKNSLCCAAAGITALPSSTTEALIPHEKLRRAAHTEATLIAQHSPPAQPAQGYKAHYNVVSCFTSGINPTSSLFSRDGSRLDVIDNKHGNATRFRFLNYLYAMKDISDRCTEFKPAYSCFSARHLIELHLTHQVIAVAHRDLKPGDHTSVASIVAKVTAGITRYICNEIRDGKQFIQKLTLRLLPSLICSLVLRTGYGNCNDNRKDRTDSLHPCRRVLLGIKSIKQYKQSPPQSADSQKQPHHPYRGHDHKRWNVQPFHSTRHLTIKKSEILPSFIAPVHGGQA